MQNLVILLLFGGLLSLTACSRQTHTDADFLDVARVLEDTQEKPPTEAFEIFDSIVSAHLKSIPKTETTEQMWRELCVPDRMRDFERLAQRALNQAEALVDPQVCQPDVRLISESVRVQSDLLSLSQTWTEMSLPLDPEASALSERFVLLWYQALYSLSDVLSARHQLEEIEWMASLEALNEVVSDWDAFYTAAIDANWISPDYFSAADLQQMRATQQNLSAFSLYAAQAVSDSTAEYGDTLAKLTNETITALADLVPLRIELQNRVELAQEGPQACMSKLAIEYAVTAELYGIAVSVLEERCEGPSCVSARESGPTPERIDTAEIPERLEGQLSAVEAALKTSCSDP